MFIITTGFGFITPLLIVAFYFGFPYFFPNMPHAQSIGLLLAATANFFISYALDKPRYNYQPYDKPENKLIKFASKNTLFFIEMKWWTLAIALASIYVYYFPFNFSFF